MIIPIIDPYAKLLNKGKSVPDTFCIDIALRCTELLEEIKRKAKENQGTRNDMTFVSREPKVETEPIHTSEQIADISKTSRSNKNTNKKTPTIIW